MDSHTAELPWREATATVIVPVGTDQHTELTTLTTVRVVYRRELEIDFFHVRDAAGRWQLQGSRASLPRSDRVVPAEKPTERLAPLVLDLLTQPQLQDVLRSMHERTLNRQVAGAWRSLSEARRLAAEAAAKVRMRDQDFQAFGVSEVRAAELLAEHERRLRSTGLYLGR
ncbi:hypothetical protein ABT095_15005 [Kitasatospora sp. NPDC002227]|uniref:hypothetical protein n=1 Tax=Kitasatospora sp. NPDC002227 TaxID=3154773 RepID=UPI00333467E1